MERSDEAQRRNGPGGPRSRVAGRAQHTAPWRVTVSGCGDGGFVCVRPGDEPRGMAWGVRMHDT